MASRSGSRKLSLSLAVIAAIVLAVTAGGWFAGNLSPARPDAGSSAAAGPATGTVTPSSAAATGASPRNPAFRGTARPGIPTTITVIDPRGRRILSGGVDPMTASRTRDGGWAPINPPTRSHAVWVTQSAAPAAPSRGTTAIYGHACIGYTCVFDNAVDTPVGSTVVLQTASSVLRYRVISITQYPKAGARSLGSRPNVADQLIVVTCAYRPDHTTVNNLVVNATLVDARNTRLDH